MLTGGTSKLPGLAEFAKEVLELPARVGNWKHIKRVVDQMDEHEFAPAVGLMLLDMYLGPSAQVGFIEQNNGIFTSVNSTVNTFVGRFRRKK